MVNIPSDFNQEPRTLSLGFLTDSYYTLINNTNYKLTLWDKRIYYIISIQYKTTDYLLASYYEGNDFNVVGIFNDADKTWDSTGDDIIDETLGDMATAYWKENSSDPKLNKDIKTEIYWNNITTNKIYHEQFGLEPIGDLVADVDEGNIIEYYIDFK